MTRCALVLLLVGTAHAAPVPKAKETAVLWSEPVRVDWKASGVNRLTGVWMPDGKAVAVPGATLSEKGEPLTGGIDLRDTDTGKVLKSLTDPLKKQGQSFQAAAVVAAQNGKAVYASGAAFAAGGKGEAARVVVIWKVNKPDDKPDVWTSVARPDDPITLHPDGSQLAMLTGEAVEVRDTTTGKVEWTNKLVGRTYGRLICLAFQFAEGMIHVGTDRGACVCYDTTNGRWKKVDTKLGVEFRTFAVSKYGKYTAYGGKALDAGQPLVIVGGKKWLNISDAVPEDEVIDGLAFSPDSKHLAAACSDGCVRVFETDGGKLAASAKGHKEAIFSVAYSPDGKKLLTVGKDAMKVWDVEALMKAK